jgi:hypothetical protein
MAPLLAGAWGALVLAAAVVVRPFPNRARELTASSGRERARSTPFGAVEVMGAFAVTLPARLRRRPAPTILPGLARRVGVACFASGAALVVSPLAMPLGGALGWLAVARAERSRERARLIAIEADLPEVVDLLSLAVGAGMNVSLAVGAVSRRCAGPLARELSRVCDDVSRGRRLAEALEDLPARSGEALRPLVAALVSSERYGTPLVEGLDRLAIETRNQQRRRCETAARKVPIALLFPLITCILPAFALLTVAPLIVSALGSLHL